MTKFTLTLDTGNAAFEGDPAPEVARILAELGERLESTSNTEGRLYDVNGNHVGGWAFKGAPAIETLEDFGQRLGLAFVASRIDGRPDNHDQWSREARHWLCTFTRRSTGASATFYFSQGPGHTDTPERNEVLGCLASDLASHMNAKDASDLAEESGITNVREALRLWDALTEAREKLTKLLGADEAENLAFQTTEDDNA